MTRHGTRLGSAGGAEAVIEIEELSAVNACVASATCSIFVCNSEMNAIN